jgi:hypothetical protein
LAPEDQLILLLTRGKLSARVTDEARALLENPLKWDVILERVTAEDVYPIFYRNLQGLDTASKEQGAGSGEQGARGKEQRAKNNQGRTLNAKNAISAMSATDAERNERMAETSGSKLHARSSMLCDRREQVLEQLQRLSKINSFRNMLLTEELVRVLGVLSEAGIPAIPLKGVALAQALYGDPSLRTCVDIDILVPRSMVGRAFDLLRAVGYKGEFGPGFFANLLLHHDIEYALTRNDRGFEYMIELHWGVLWGGKAEESVTDQLWADAQPATVFGSPAYALSPEWHILFLAAHAARHQWQGLKWLVDLHELYSAHDIDWEKLTGKAKQLGWQELLRISFLSCHSLFDTPIPKKYLLGELPSWVKLFPDSAPANLSGAFFATRFLTRTSDKLRYVARVLLVPTLAEWRLVQLPAFVSYLYYPLRPLRLMCKWTWGFLAWSVEHGARSKA